MNFLQINNMGVLAALTDWSKHVQQWRTRFLERTLTARNRHRQDARQFGTQQNTTPPAQRPSSERVAPAPKQHAAPPLAPLSPDQEHAQIAMTPLAWRAGLPPAAALIGYVDVQTLQLIELRSMSADDMTALLKVALFASYASTWQTVGEHRLRRLDFPPATRFAQNSHPALSLEELLSHRWQASTELAEMDQALLLAKQQYDAALAIHHGQAIDDCPPLEQAFLAMQDLRSARAGAVDELVLLANQIDTAFVQWGVPPPHLSTGPS